jgi:amino acid transporter
MLKKWSAHMQVIFSGICILVFFVTTVNLGPLDLGGWLKAAIMIPVVFLVVYSLARIQPKERTSRKNTKK